MNTGSRSTFLFMWFVHITIQVLEAQEVRVPSEVTGYLRHNVTLPCRFIQGPREAHITFVQWDVEQMEGQRITIVVSSPKYGLLFLDTFLRGRVEVAEQSLLIKDVEMGDAGSYTCSVTAFPDDTSRTTNLAGTTNLIVREQRMWFPGMIAAGVFVIAVVTMLATTCFISRMRRSASVGYDVPTESVYVQ